MVLALLMLLLGCQVAALDALVIASAAAAAKLQVVLLLVLLLVSPTTIGRNKGFHKCSQSLWC